MKFKTWSFFGWCLNNCSRFFQILHKSYSSIPSWLFQFNSSWNALTGVETYWAGDCLETTCTILKTSERWSAEYIKSIFFSRSKASIVVETLKVRASWKESVKSWWILRNFLSFGKFSYDKDIARLQDKTLFLQCWIDVWVTFPLRLGGLLSMLYWALDKDSLSDELSEHRTVE